MTNVRYILSPRQNDDEVISYLHRVIEPGYESPRSLPKIDQHVNRFGLGLAKLQAHSRVSAPVTGTTHLGFASSRVIIVTFQPLDNSETKGIFSVPPLPATVRQGNSISKVAALFLRA